MATKHLIEPLCCMFQEKGALDHLPPGVTPPLENSFVARQLSDGLCQSSSISPRHQSTGCPVDHDLPGTADIEGQYRAAGGGRFQYHTGKAFRPRRQEQRMRPGQITPDVKPRTDELHSICDPETVRQGSDLVTEGTGPYEPESHARPQTGSRYRLDCRFRILLG
jgi:hypothetical protein